MLNQYCVKEFYQGEGTEERGGKGGRKRFGFTDLFIKNELDKARI